MKILLATSSTGWSGGQHQVYLLAKGLKQRGNSVSVITSNNSELGKKLIADGFDVHFFRMNKEADIFTIIKMAFFLKREKFDIINVHRPTAHTIVMAANLLSGHSVFFVTRRVPYGIPSRISAKIKYDWFVNGVIAISNEVKQSIVKTGVREEAITVIHDAIDIDKFNPSDTLPAEELKGAGPVIGTVGNANKQKGHQYFISAIPAILKKYPNALFVDVGVRDEDTELMELAKDLGIRNKIIFAGFRQDVGSYLKAMDLFIFPSIVEGLGTALLEAMSMQKPVVVSKTGGMTDVIIDKENGIFVPPASSQAIARAVCSLLDNPSYMEELGRKARQTVVKDFSINIISQKTEELFKSAL